MFTFIVYRSNSFALKIADSDMLSQLSLSCNFHHLQEVYGRNSHPRSGNYFLSTLQSILRALLGAVILYWPKRIILHLTVLVKKHVHETQNATAKNKVQTRYKEL